jgi:hypothetical protein
MVFRVVFDRRTAESKHLEWRFSEVAWRASRSAASHRRAIAAAQASPRVVIADEPTPRSTTHKAWRSASCGGLAGPEGGGGDPRPSDAWRPIWRACLTLTAVYLQAAMIIRTSLFPIVVAAILKFATHSHACSSCAASDPARG